MTEKTAQKEPGKKPAPSKKPKPQQEVVVQIPLSELHPFPDHPFQVREDASMQETAESVKEYGVLVLSLIHIYLKMKTQPPVKPFGPSASAWRPVSEIVLLL